MNLDQALERLQAIKEYCASQDYSQPLKNEWIKREDLVQSCQEEHFRKLVMVMYAEKLLQEAK